MQLAWSHQLTASTCSPSAAEAHNPWNDQYTHSWGQRFATTTAATTTSADTAAAAADTDSSSLVLSLHDTLAESAVVCVWPYIISRPDNTLVVVSSTRHGEREWECRNTCQHTTISPSFLLFFSPYLILPLDIWVETSETHKDNI